MGNTTTPTETEIEMSTSGAGERRDVPVRAAISAAAACRGAAVSWLREAALLPVLVVAGRSSARSSARRS